MVKTEKNLKTEPPVQYLLAIILKLRGKVPTGMSPDIDDIELAKQRLSGIALPDFDQVKKNIR